MDSIGQPLFGAIEDHAENFLREDTEAGTAISAKRRATRSEAPGEAFQFSVESSNQIVSRDVEDPGEAAEITVAEIDEQRRQEEADRANRLYDLPMDTDGPRFGEPVTDRFAPEIPDDIAVNLKEGEGEQIGQALVATRMEQCRAVGWASRWRNS